MAVKRGGLGKSLDSLIPDTGKVPEKVKVDDRMLKGFLKLGQLAWYGYRSMIEFLPGKLQIVPKGLAWCLSFMPRRTARALNSDE